MTQNENEFNSEYCNVKYVEQDNVVLLVWEKFCCFEDYRLPTMFAANLLHKHKGSNFVIDARNGFEDEKADVEWGFSVLLPYMAKSDCKICVFIMSEISTIDGEIDLWSKEFMRYFEVKKVLSYEDAVEFIRGSAKDTNMIERDIQNRIDIHSKIQKELLEYKSVAAFLYLIPQGRELELSYHGTGAFVSMYPSKAAVSLWCANEKQAFESIEELLENAVIDGRRLIEIWDEITLDTLF